MDRSGKKRFIERKHGWMSRLDIIDTLSITAAYQCSVLRGFSAQPAAGNSVS